MELSKTQREIVNSNEKYIAVMSVPSSGKTRLLSERVNELLRRGVNPNKIVVITFTNNAAAELRDRIESNIPFIGTIHSYANHLLRLNGVETKTFIEEEDFEKLISLTEEIKEIPQVEHLLLDEAQDTSQSQFNFILDIINPENFFFVGDPRQHIYSFRNGESDNFLDLIQSEEITVYYMNENYRNSISITNFAKKIINRLPLKYYKDTSINMNTDWGQVITLKENYEEMCKAIKCSRSDYRDWFVLVRTNKQLDIVYKALCKAQIPCEKISKSREGLKNYQNKLAYNNTVKVMTIHSAKGLEADNVVVFGAQFYSAEEIRVSYVAATRARKKLIWMWRKGKI